MHRLNSKFVTVGQLRCLFPCIHVLVHRVRVVLRLRIELHCRGLYGEFGRTANQYGCDTVLQLVLRLDC